MAANINIFPLPSITIERRKRADFAYGLVGCPYEDRTEQAPWYDGGNRGGNRKGGGP